MKTQWITVGLLMLLVWMRPVHAQPTSELESVWLYDAERGALAQVNTEGTLVTEISLPLPAAYLSNQFSRQVAISPDGTRVAYSLNGDTSSETAQSGLIFYDLQTQTVLSSYQTPQLAMSDSLTFSRAGWNEDGTLFAYAYAIGDDLDTQGWQMIIVNAADGRIISELDASSIFFSAQSQQLAPYLLPVVQFYDAGLVTFTLIPYQTLTLNHDLDSYEWDGVTGRVSKTNRAPSLRGDTLRTTGESIMPVSDERVYYNNDLDPYTNALHVYRPALGARSPFFATRGYDVISAQFIQNGETVLVQAQDATLEEAYLLVNRIGVSRTLPTIQAVNDQWLNLPDGVVYMQASRPPALMVLNTRQEPFEPTMLWQAPMDSQFVPVWTAAPDVTSTYDAWLQLAPPIFEAQIVVSSPNETGVSPQSLSTPIPDETNRNSIITVDSVAIVNTTEGDRLNMRNTPGLNGSVTARVEAGTRLVIIGGPVARDGFTWWEVRLPNGQTGWMVERADNVQTLQPAN